jgi:hypothetical protein
MKLGSLSRPMKPFQWHIAYTPLISNTNTIVEVILMPHEAISTPYLRNPLISCTNTTASQVLEVIPLISLEFQGQSLWDLVCHAIWGHLNNKYHKSFPLSNTYTTASQIIEVIILILPKCPNRSSWNVVHVSCHLRPSRVVYFINHSPISDTITSAAKTVLVTSLHIHTKVSVLPLASDTQITVKGK